MLGFVPRGNETTAIRRTAAVQTDRHLFLESYTGGAMFIFKIHTNNATLLPRMTGDYLNIHS